MNQGQTHRLKTVEHYVLQNLFHTTPIAQFWTASHKVLKKQFVVKKIKSDSGASSSRNITLPPFDGFELARQQTTILSQIRNLSSPKCQKLIRTSHSTYIVYNPFPGQTLASLLSQARLNVSQVLSVMVMIAEELISLHEAGVILCTFDESNIYVNKGKSIFFGDWTLSRSTDSEIDQVLMSVMSQVPSYLTSNGYASWKLDVYQFGKILDRVLNKVKKQLSSGMTQKLKLVINSMTTQNEEEIMEFNGVVKLLRQLIKSISGNEPQTPKFSASTRTNLSIKADSRTTADLERVKSSKNLITIPIDLFRSDNALQSRSRGRDRAFTPENNQKNNHLRLTSRVTERPQVKTQGCISVVRKEILKIRGYVSFVLQLSISMIDVNPQICMLLIKMAMKGTEDLEEMSEEIKEESVTLAIELRSILRNQNKNIEKIIFLFKTNCHSLDISQDMAISQKSVDPNYLNCKIKELVQRELKNPLNDKNFKEKNDFYFRLYELSFSLKYGSLQNFWDKHYSIDLPPNRQTFLSKERCLGMRYFRGKIEQAVQLF